MYVSSNTMAAHEYYNPSPQTVPGPGILKPTAGYPTSTYRQQPQYDIQINQRPEYPPSAIYPQSYSPQQPHYPPLQQPGEYNPASSGPPQPYDHQSPTQQPYHRDAHHQYPAVEPQSYQNLPPHLRPRRSISEPPDPRYLAHHIPGYHHRGRSRSRYSSSSSSSSSERSSSPSRSKIRPRSHCRQARSTRSMSRSRRRGGSRSHSRSLHPRASIPSPRDGNNHKDRNTFFGAFGGGAIGDLIMPGLGTLGGALLGGVGGREVSRNRYKNEKSGRRGGRRIFGGSRKTYDEEWREGRIQRGEISE
ncbi:hypothetical protein NHQ30_002555 [Ciborinia camelliae]|nr:hypothetical protein NHQ30_002555 [Ciborinia camelliae]